MEHAIHTCDATLYTPKYLNWYAKHETPKGERFVSWMIRVDKAHVYLLIDYKNKNGWTGQKTVLL